MEAFSGDGLLLWHLDLFDTPMVDGTFGGDLVNCLGVWRKITAILPVLSNIFAFKQNNKSVYEKNIPKLPKYVVEYSIKVKKLGSWDEKICIRPNLRMRSYFCSEKCAKRSKTSYAHAFVLGEARHPMPAHAHY